MSVESWKKEFYGDVEEAAKSDIAAIDHAIKKYEGASPENLELHEVRIKGYSLSGKIWSPPTFLFSGDTCALCSRYFEMGSNDPCIGCPLYKATGLSCDSEGDLDAFSVFCNDGDAAPMLLGLRKARELVSPTIKGKKIETQETP